MNYRLFPPACWNFRGLVLVATLLAIAFTSMPPYLIAQGGEDDAASGGMVTVATSDGKIDSVLAIISTQIEGSVSPFGKVAGNRVTILAEEQPVEAVLNQLANPNGWVWWREDTGDYGISDREYYERTILPKRVIQKVFRPNNVKASELDRAIKQLLTPNVGTSVADDRTNKLIVNDLPQALERIERFIREIDIQLIVRVFYIRHADVEDIASKLENYKSGPGTIEVDAKTHQIIVTDLLSNIKKMELLIDILDVGPEIVIYDVNNIGIEGEDLEDLQAIIESIRTDDDTLLFEVNEKQGVFILEDVPEVHERVEQVLQGFDQPVKQVLIQGEILSTSFSRDFSYGVTRFAMSEDLLSAASQGALGSGALGGSLGDSGTSAGDLIDGGDVGYSNIYDIFPNFDLSGKTISANYLGSHAMVSYSAAYEDTTTRVLLQPRILVKNQQTSRIFVGTEEPYLTTYFDDNSSNSSSGYRSYTPNYITTGLTFEVTPSIANSFLIELELQIENDGANQVSLPTGDGITSNVVAYQRERQQVETTLQIPSGQTRMIGGLIDDSDTKTNSGLPYLVDLPVIGSLFGQQAKIKTARNLMIFITPSVIEDQLPPSKNEGGRRGNLVTAYERTAGDFDLDLDEDEADTEKIGIKAPDDYKDLLSTDASEESDLLSKLEDEQKRRQEELLNNDGDGNYSPTVGIGSASLNSGAPGEPAKTRPKVTPPASGPGSVVQPERSSNSSRAPRRTPAPRQNSLTPSRIVGETTYR